LDLGLARFYDIGPDVGDAESLAPAGPHWYLHWLGTEPTAQGRGTGSTPVRQVTARADAEDVAYHLLNFVPRNMPIYEHLGFRVILDTVLSLTGLRFWVMARQPLVQLCVSHQGPVRCTRACAGGFISGGPPKGARMVNCQLRLITCTPETAYCSLG
jgi:Acetyltransferase (GNAT) family